MHLQKHGLQINKSDNKPKTLEGYQNYHGVKGKPLKSGCGFYVKEGINFKPRKDLEITYSDEDNEFQCSWIELPNWKWPNILVGLYYTHPKKKSDSLFLLKLKQTLTKLRDSNKVTVVTGDFNYDILKYEKNSSEFLNLMYSNFLRPYILEPTRIVANNRPSITDNIFINTIDKKTDSGNITDKESDHMPNFLLIKDITERKKYQKIKIRVMKTSIEKIPERTRADLCHVNSLT